MHKSKKINIIVPCYNEEQSVFLLYEIVTEMFKEKLCQYSYDLIFIDDYSKDKTREKIRELCEKDKEHVRAIFNASNFGFSRNVFSALTMSDGDAAFLVFGDLQNPPDLLPEFVSQWEKGSRVIIGQKQGNNEGRFMRFMRKLYYDVISVLSDKSQIKHFNGFGLYDRSFIDILKQIDDMQPYLKQVVAEYASDYSVIPYQQQASNRGRSNFNFYRNYDFAMEGITSCTKKLMRLSTLCGLILGLFSAFYAMSVIIKKILNWTSYPFGMASITVGIFFLGAMQLFFIGILGEYILSINTKTLRRPRVIISEKINFEKNLCDGETEI